MIELEVTTTFINTRTGEEKVIEAPPLENLFEHVNLEKIRKKGSGRQKCSKGKKDKYVLEYEGRKYLCKTHVEIAEITGRSRHCISRLVRGLTTFRCPSKSAELKNIKITVL